MEKGNKGGREGGMEGGRNEWREGGKEKYYDPSSQEGNAWFI